MSKIAAKISYMTDEPLKPKSIKGFEAGDDEQSDYHKFPTFKQVNEDLAKLFSIENRHEESYFATVPEEALPDSPENINQPEKLQTEPQKYENGPNFYELNVLRDKRLKKGS